MECAQIRNAILYFGEIFFKHIPVDVNCWIAGGALTDYFTLGHATNDIDVFFEHKYHSVKVASALCEKGGKISFENDRITNVIYNHRKIQLIKSFVYPTVKDCIASFDFTICACAATREEIFHAESFFIDLAGKRLVVQKLPFPLSTMERMQKYIKKGYTICNGGLLELAKAINSLDLKDVQQNAFQYYPDGSPRFMKID